ncbi:MAG: hemerythrin domain-containing protein [Povalibacter sp.]|jgi:hemerythrin superfamily protein
MASADSSNSDEPIADAIDLLTRDHRLVEELFAAFSLAAPQQLEPLARRACKMLRVHTQIEEELFYPVARRALQNDDIINEAEQEHAEAKQTIARVESMSSDHPNFKATVGELSTQIAHHVAEEEQQLFPKLRATGANFVSLGIALAERRATLLDTFGLHADDEEGAANQREILQPSKPVLEDRDGSRTKQ